MGWEQRAGSSWSERRRQHVVEHVKERMRRGGSPASTAGFRAKRDAGSGRRRSAF